jgi:hypothetical protein
MHAIHYKYAPASFNHIWTLNHESNLESNLNLCNNYSYSIPYPRIELFKKSPFYMLPKTWNDLCINVKAQHNKTTISIALKDYLLESEGH